MATTKEPPVTPDQKKSNAILWIWAVVLVLCGILMAVKFLYS